MDKRTGLPIVGMVGGGQLARMTHQAAISLGQSLRVLAAGENESAGLVAGEVVQGHHTDLEALRSFAAGVDVLTFDHEHVPGEHLLTLAMEGVTIRPDPAALSMAQNKLVMREMMAGLEIPGPDFAEVSAVDDVISFGDKHSWPVVLKAAQGGYDGRGVWMLDTAQHARETVTELLDAGTPLLVEEKVVMRRELSALVARSPFGQGAAWPVVETVQSGGINTEVLAPAPGLSYERTQQAQDLALQIAATLNVTGLLAVELFETDEGLLVNELAMRPHNSGHWTQDGSRTSQFEQHLRAVLDYPLGATDLIAPACVMANVLGAPEAPEMGPDERLHHLFARYPDVRVHLYGKGERPGRKLGHVNFVGERMEELRDRALLSAHWLSHAVWLDGYEIH
ncbi:5-(carboxyamino)imidazole ribonucleotide synthase [Amycolatopsis regifaucium]|uniref:N5-carboxyaminoimidazole ribonucleotide synthase n=1 Tax=Amycolatopsis regifaucium TaxID=546365 RepID=A0A154MDK7_9PSEU|nr:5-(carboxyamino)imidazole ribonucleotide synthase [Amycolatopsis regifaucium]KZB82303.1 phosphoribosylaminoimidazole carboxylase [Amycolatopsis regifaucium]OKA10304.1 5-(carboxyamino)imidazole ribonucleotide synthase [Amycolatopsis regifaucium]SFG89239.1 5-(carboxyamino)imidazole ribonucleotide synthase [Amycolatopsis regifaucium]